MKANKLLSGSLLLIAGLLLSACAAAATPAAPATSTPEPTSEPRAMPGPTPEVKVSDQAIKDGRVTIDSVTAAEQGWIVIHVDQNGGPGPIIGESAVKAGENSNVQVQIDASQATPKLWAMLHVDQGVVGTYEFPGPDAPVKIGDQIVMTPFNASQPASSGAAGTVVLKVGQTDKLGQFLTDDQGQTLYVLLNDSANTSSCTDSCAQTWPPFVTTEANPAVGDGLDAKLLGTLTRADGSQQLTYNQRPLYHFAGDAKPGDTNGQGIGSVWFVASPKGEPVNQQSSSNNGNDSGNPY
jgi:predicted lipoprotein with Yx(FWY)xxD motif